MASERKPPKKGLQSVFAAPVASTPEPQPSTKTPEVAPVQSSLPPMTSPLQQQIAPSKPITAPQQMVAAKKAPVQQQQFSGRPELGVGYQQRASAITDPRFAQALTQRFQQDLAARQQELAQKQQQFQKELESSSGYSGGLAAAQGRIAELAQKVSSGIATEGDLSEYERLQSMQFKGPEGLGEQAGIAALARMAGSPALLAQQYATLAPGYVSGQQISQSLAGLSGGALGDIRSSAAALQQEQLTAEQAAMQQSALASREAEAIQQAAKGRIKAESEKYLSGLRGESEKDVAVKKAALDKIKEGLFLTGQISKSDLSTLGLDESSVEGVQGLNLTNIQGLKKPVSSVSDLKDVIDDLNLKNESELTPEQQNLINVYNSIEALAQDPAISGKYAFAKAEDLAKIQALERLVGGRSQIKAEDIGRGREGGKLSKQAFASLKDIATDYGSDVITIPKTFKNTGEVKQTQDITYSDVKQLTPKVYGLKTLLSQLDNSLKYPGSKSDEDIQKDIDGYLNRFMNSINDFENQTGKSLKSFIPTIDSDLGELRRYAAEVTNKGLFGTGLFGPAVDMKNAIKNKIEKMKNQLGTTYDALKASQRTRSSVSRSLRLTD